MIDVEGVWYAAPPRRVDSVCFCEGWTVGGSESHTEAQVMTKVNLIYEKTGEVRCPREGEWFEDTEGRPHQARFTFHVQKFKILREVIQREENI